MNRMRMRIVQEIKIKGAEFMNARFNNINKQQIASSRQLQLIIKFNMRLQRGSCEFEDTHGLPSY